MGSCKTWISRTLRAIFVAYLTVGVGLTPPPFMDAQAPPLTLFKRSEFVPRNEAMSDEQRNKIASFRPGEKDTEVTFVRMNREALRGKVLAVEMPNGKNYTFTGGTVKNSGRSRCRSGTAAHDGEMAYVCVDGDRVGGYFFLNGKGLQLFDYGDIQLLIPPTIVDN